MRAIPSSDMPLPAKPGDYVAVWQYAQHRGMLVLSASPRTGEALALGQAEARGNRWCREGRVTLAVVTP